eukprot:m.61502 g.61502  ORF g.61502 m.61502 type:complete len:433 (-) comp7343_c0_seq2:2-1300(-)
MADTPAPRGRKRKGRKRSSTSDAAAADPAADSAAAAADVSEEDSRKRMCRRREPEIQPCEDIVFVRENGFRRVLPYDYDFKCFCKGRWLGRTLMDVFESEFRAETPERYRQAIVDGEVTVNGEKVEPDHVLRDGDYMVNRVHRHEPPVTDQPIEIIAQNDDYIVVDKPASIPVHPSGRYRHNTILLLLGHEHDIWNISTCHRLDRLTSGLLILAKHKDASRRMEAQISSRSVQKEYISRVEGVFPEEEIVCEQPIKQVSHKLGLSAVHPEGKPCRTTFRRIATNGKESLVRCIPHTGRMHQIRIHLQYLGHPISNDPLYRRSEWGVVDGKGPSAETIERITTAVAASQNHRENEITSVPMSPPDRSDPRYRPNCSDCHSKWPDPTEESLRIYLHAISYAGEGWKYETPLPAWAREFEVAAESKDGNYYDMHN